MRVGQIIATAVIVALVLLAAGGGWFLRSSVAEPGAPRPTGAPQDAVNAAGQVARAVLGAGRTQGRAITVAGVGQVQAKPDLASVSLGVQIQARAARDAQSENSELMTKVIDAIKAQGIEDKDISTHGLSLRPRFNREGDTVDAYVATNNVSVTVRDLDKVGEVLDAGFAAGANLAGGVQFAIADPTSFRDHAMELAVVDARARADVLAKAAGVTVESVMSISEESGGFPSPRGIGGVSLESASLRMATPIESGELTISVRVHVVYSIGS